MGRQADTGRGTRSGRHQPGRLETPPITTSDQPAALSVLAILPALDDHASMPGLLQFAEGLAAQGHRMRLVTAAGPTLREMRAHNISCWQVHHTPGRSSPAIELAQYASAIYRALCAEPTHIVQSASIRATYAAALAAFAYMLRHPCAQEPAIVTTISDGEEDTVADVYVRASRHLRLLGDAIIVLSERSRDALMAAVRDRRLGKRIHVVTSGRDFIRATVAVYRVAWDRRQSINQRAHMPIEI